MAQPVSETAILAVYITMPAVATAEEFGTTLVRERLAACVTMLHGATSTYWWEGEVQTATECVCFFKTTAERFPAFLQRARELHPYVVPCIVAWPLTAGNPDYCNWVRTETR